MRNKLKSLIGFFPYVLQIYRYSRHLFEQNKKSNISKWNFYIYGNSSMSEGTFEPEETNVVRRLLKDVDKFINVGANIGYYCCHALSLGKPVIAVEPNTQNLFFLMKNILSNGWSKDTEIFPVALSFQTSILKMYGGGTGASLIRGWASIPESFVSNVPVLTLDRIIGDSIKGKKVLILADVEGAEMDFLLGAKQTLINEPRPIWIIEITTTENQPDQSKLNPNYLNTFLTFFNLGYRAYTANEKQEEITLSTVESVLRNEIKLNVHNFIFQM